MGYTIINEKAKEKRWKKNGKLVQSSTFIAQPKLETVFYVPMKIS